MRPYSIILPTAEQNGVIFDSPHSGTYLPESFVRQIAIDPALLHYSGDILVDQLIRHVSRHGATRFINHYARTYVDTNRSAREIDPDMFSGLGRMNNFEKSDKVIRGFGVISRKSYNGRDIYEDKIPAREIDVRLDQVYHPVHRALGGILREIHQKHNFYILIDCHSMPSYKFLDPTLSAVAQPDLIIGNCHDKSCSRRLTRHVADYFTRHGLNIKFNAPYAGGFNTRHYSCTDDNRHAVQLEFNRALYMDEETLEQNSGFDVLQSLLTGLSESLNHNLGALLPRQLS